MEIRYKEAKIKAKYLARGKRSVVYIANYKNKKIAIKVKRKDSKAKFRIQNEAKWLKILNKYKIGPKLLYSNKNYIIYDFVKGKRIIDWLKMSNKKQIIKVLIEILSKCRTLDKLNVNKEELHNPYKHILISKNAKMIDFERCYKTNKPKNITQFCQFLMSNKVYNILKEKKIIINQRDLIRILKDYKRDYSEIKFNEILKLLKGG